MTREQLEAIRDLGVLMLSKGLMNIETPLMLESGKWEAELMTDDMELVTFSEGSFIELVGAILKAGK